MRQSFAQGDIAKATIAVEKIQLKGANEITIFAQSFRESLQKLKETFHTIQQRTFALQNVVQKLMRLQHVEESNAQIADRIIEIAASKEKKIIKRLY